jgi:hypothetical protein
MNIFQAERRSRMEARTYSGTVAELAANDMLSVELTALWRACPHVKKMNREETLSCMWQAEGSIREETNVIASCLERLQELEEEERDGSREPE